MALFSATARRAVGEDAATNNMRFHYQYAVILLRHYAVINTYVTG